MKKEELIQFFKEKRKDFPILKEEVNNHTLVYADNAATSQKPFTVIDKLVEFYTTTNSNIHRGIHTLSEKATKEYEEVREKVANFINSNSKEIVFTSGTTESINIIARGLENQIFEGDEIVLTEFEHHANLVPWQELAKRKGAVLKFIPFNENYNIDIGEVKKIISDKTKIVSIPHISNVTGSVLPVKEIVKIAHYNNSLLVLDAAQSVSCKKIDVKDLDCDFMVFSAHKMCGPTGVGVLYGKFEELEKLDPSMFGGSMIEDVELEESKYNQVPFKFEAGTPNVANVVAFGSAIDYLEEITLERIDQYQKLLTRHFLEKSKEIEGFSLIGSENFEKRVPVFSFTLEKLHSFDLATLFDKKGIAIRSGTHCAMPLHKKIDTDSSSRISLYFYNTLDEIDYILETLKNLIKRYS